MQCVRDRIEKYTDKAMNLIWEGWGTFLLKKIDIQNIHKLFECKRQAWLKMGVSLFC